ncbi:MAG: aspartate aminotransferase, partial [Proteobacteria bacterium]|nr:aspartate aminotransferase [Pseudomonadota bacterium]
MKYNFDEIISREGTSSLKWEKYTGRDILPMWVADMDFKAPPQVLDTLRQSIEHGILGYTTVPETLNDVIIQKLWTLYNWKVKKEWILWIPGVVCGLNIACTTFGRPQDNVVTTTPIYPPFLSAPLNCGKKLVTIPMIDKNLRATLDFDTLEKEL